MNKFILFMLVAFLLVTSGCATVGKTGKSAELSQEIVRLQGELDQLILEREAEIERLRSEKDSEIERMRADRDSRISDLGKAKRDLEEKLKKEIDSYQAKLEITERGLVITFLAEIFFDSGKDTIKPGGGDALKKVATVLRAGVSKLPVAVEGYTDNEPIKHSGWKSNWELSSARALAVLHYFIDECDIKPERLSAVACGEYKFVASNKTAEGRAKNRRVEIVILPTSIKKVKTVTQ